MKHARRFVCRRFNIEYIEVPKVACTSIKAAILNTDGQNTPKTTLRIHHNPWWCEVDVEPVFTFTFVRHPCDRLVSCYWDKIARGRGEEIGLDIHKATPFADFVRLAFAQDEPDPHYAPQTSILRRSRVDWIGRFDRLLSGWCELQLRFPGLDYLKRYNASERPYDWRDMYDEETLELALDYYSDDFKRWPQYAGEACRLHRV